LIEPHLNGNEERMIRPYTACLALVLLGACRARTPESGQQASEGERTGSPYSTGRDSGAVRQRMEGTNTGVEFEAPRRIPGVLATLTQVVRQPDQRNLTALRGDLSSMEDAMRDDFRRVGLSDTGAFSALADSLAFALGGGSGGLAKPADAAAMPKIERWVRGLVDTYNRMMGSVRQ
jgi:hypothetical protein